jgi:hypothetical protein
VFKFFRRIRHSLFTENKISKYSVYAIGEIILVVIGILIALQINNWNEQRKIRAVEITYLENISTDLQLNIKALQEFITSREVCIKASDSMIAMFEGERPIDVDDFNRYGIDVMVWYPFQQNDNTYQELLNSGKLSLITNKTIKNQLQNMQSSFKKVTFVENEMQQDYEQYLYDPFFNYADLNTSFKNYNSQIANEPTEVSLDIEQVNGLLKNQLFKNGFVLSAYNSEILINEYSDIMETTKQLISLIENELNQ